MSLKDELIREMERRDREREWQASLGESIPIPMDASYEKRNAGREPSLIGDVAVPFLQAVVCGVGGAIVGGLLFRSVQAAGVGAAVAFVGSWLLLLVSTRQLLYSLESLTRKDFNRDGAVGAPEPRRVTVELVENNKQQRIRYLDLPIGDDKLSAVANAVLVAGYTFSRDALATKASILSQNEYRALADAMERGGLLVTLANNKRELTAAGRSALRQLLDD